MLLQRRSLTSISKFLLSFPAFHAAEWDKKAQDLAGRFIKNFKKYETNEAGKALVAAGPKL